MSQETTRHPQYYGKELYATHGSDVLCSPAELDLTNLAPCSHEEADTRLLLHVADAVLKGRIRTVDTDMLVVAVASLTKSNPMSYGLLLALGQSSLHSRP